MILRGCEDVTEIRTQVLGPGLFKLLGLIAWLAFNARPARPLRPDRFRINVKPLQNPPHFGGSQRMGHLNSTVRSAIVAPHRVTALHHLIR